MRRWIVDKKRLGIERREDICAKELRTENEDNLVTS